MTVQVALCDDERAELNEVKKFLSAYEQEHVNTDFTVRYFPNADEFLGAVREKKYSPHLVIMDIYMPKETGERAPVGLEAARQLQGMGNRAALVFLTRSREYALEAFEVQAAHYLVKPIQTEKFFSVLDRVRIGGKKTSASCCGPTGC